MDGITRMYGLTTGERVQAERRTRDEAFRAWHRQPDAEPDPAVEDRPARTATRLRRLVARLVVA